MIITAELAQQIVDHIMPIVQQNINIMNSSAMIMGSGQKNRLNTYHQGAMNVIQTGDVVEIYPEDVDRFPGSLPGLNWPITLGNQIVGVVGVSGHPNDVRNTARLVKMVTELILERESMVEEFRSNLQLKEQFVHLLLADQYQDNAKQISKISRLLRFNLDFPRIVAVANIRPILEAALKQYGPYDLVTSRTKEKLTQLIDCSQLINQEDLFVFTENELIVLKHFPEDALPTDFYQWGESVVRLLENSDGYKSICLGMGCFTSLPSELCHSYVEAKFSQNSDFSRQSVVSIYDLDILASFLIKIPGATDTCLALRILKNTIHNLGAKYDMQKTIDTLLANNLNVSSAAKALFIHRNTLVFRLEKLKELTGLSPDQSFNHALLCKILLD